MSSVIESYMMWSEQTVHMVQNSYFELLVSCESLNNSLSDQNFLLESPLILVSKVTDVQRLWKIKKDIRIMLFISFILQFHPLRHVTGFHRSHHIYCDLPLNTYPANSVCYDTSFEKCKKVQLYYLVLFLLINCLNNFYILHIIWNMKF